MPGKMTEKEFEKGLVEQLSSGKFPPRLSAFVAYGFRNWMEEYGDRHDSEIDEIFKWLGQDGYVWLVPEGD